MYVSQVNGMNFGSSKQMFVNQKQLELIRGIAKKMRGASETVKATENSVTVNCVGAISAGDCVLYNDTFLHGKNKNTEEGCVGVTQMKFGDEFIIVNNDTGEIVRVVKSETTPLENILQKVDNILPIFNLNFDKDSIVAKSIAKITSLTEIGQQRVMSGQLVVDGSADE